MKNINNNKLNTILSYEKDIQNIWEKEKRNNINCKIIKGEEEEEEKEKKNKYFVTFPYPYMNGKLHLGHAFSLTKAEFSARFQRLLGKDVLFPFGFHCTGMPILACANKLKEENKKKEEGEEEKEKTYKTQNYIMKKMGYDVEEIKKFEDPNYWIEHFPPIAIKDLKQFGVSVDFRRSFVTTEINPFYDSFIRWQFEVLKSKGYISFGKKYSIYSTIDKLVCADHDRTRGEGVKPVEHTIIKLKVQYPYPECIKEFSDNDEIYLAPATFRPETMYGQTNCWVLPNGEYGIFEFFNKKREKKEYYILTERAARNLSYQEMTENIGEYKCLKKMKGYELFGTKLKAPNCKYESIYVLPLSKVKMDIGTGIVTSVPSDSPDDYIGYKDLRENKEMREKYKINEEWIKNEIVSIIDVDGDGMSAETICKKNKIKTQKDVDLLELSKKVVYLNGFTRGILKDTCDKYAGKKIIEVKDIIKKELIDNSYALLYAEPEEEVISRSGDVCVVALVDQWYINYADKNWKKLVMEHLEDNKMFQTYNSKTVLNELIYTCDWLNEWGCSRSYGLGTKLPFDENYIIESLSDSTIYMAYYTVCHLLQGEGSLDGKKIGVLGIKPEEMKKIVWDYIFLDIPYPKDEKDIPTEEKLNLLKEEFKYWYPVDLRVSAKDLIKNHLTMFLFNHAAIFNKKEYMPKSIFCNGYIMVDGKKMSKSEGNFYTLEEIINKYSSDGSRMTLADSGDLLDDANFERKNAEKNLLRLYTHINWVKQIKNENLRTGEFILEDKIFDEKINKTIIDCKKYYENLTIRNALRTSIYDFETSRDVYKNMCKIYGGVHKDLILKFIKVFTIISSPIIPHTSEYVWRVLLDNKSSVFDEKWPIVKENINMILIYTDEYLQNILHIIRKKQKKSKEQKKGNNIKIIIKSTYTENQKLILSILKNNNNFDIKSITKIFFKEKKFNKNIINSLMSFTKNKIEEYNNIGISALDEVLPINEIDLLKDKIDLIKKLCEIENIEILDFDKLNENEKKKYEKNNIFPRFPFITFY